MSLSVTFKHTSWFLLDGAGHEAVQMSAQSCPLPGKTLSFLNVWAQVTSHLSNLSEHNFSSLHVPPLLHRVTVTPDGSSGLRIPAVFPALSEDAGEGFSASRIFRGQLPSVLSCAGAHSASCPYGLSKYNCAEYLYAVVV